MKKFSRALVLTPTPTHPQNFGNRNRIFNVCSALRDRGVPLDLLHYPSEWDWRNVMPAKDLAAMHAAWDNVFTVPPSRPLHAYAIGQDHDIDEWWDQGVGHYLDWLFRVRTYTHFIVNYTWLSRSLLHVPPGVLRILDTHDRFAGRRELLSSLGVAAEFFHTTVEQEKFALDRADVILAIKAEERDYFATQTDRTVLTLIHAEAGKYVPQPTLPSIAQRPLRLGFLGAQNSINKENFRAFLDAIVPALRETMASIEIVLAGSLCQDFVDYEAQEITLLGYVDDVADFYNGVDAVVAPIARSTGLKIKVGEALAFGKPVISLRHAFEGYEPTHRYQTVDTMLEFVRACIQLSFDQAELTQMGMLARVSHRRSLASFDETIDHLVATRPSGGRCFLVCVDASISSYRSASGNRQIDVIRYLAHLGETFIYVAAPLSKADIRTIADFPLPGTKILSAAANPGVASGSITVATLQDVLTELPVAAIWLSALMPNDEAALAAFAGTVVFDAEASNLGEPRQAGTGPTMIAHYPTVVARGSFWREQPPDRLFPLPFFMNPQAELHDSWRGRWVGDGIIVLTDASSEQNLVTIMEHPSLGRYLETARIVANLGVETKPAGQGPAGNRLPLAHIARDLRRIGSRPLACIDMCDGHEFAFVRELMLRFDVPLLHLPQLAQVARQQSAVGNGSGGSSRVLQDIDVASVDTSVLFDNDAGWCQVWGLLSQD